MSQSLHFGIDLLDILISDVRNGIILYRTVYLYLNYINKNICRHPNEPIIRSIESTALNTDVSKPFPRMPFFILRNMLGGNPLKSRDTGSYFSLPCRIETTSD